MIYIAKLFEETTQEIKDRYQKFNSRVLKGVGAGYGGRIGLGLGIAAGHLAGLSHMANGGDTEGYKHRLMAGAGLGTLAGGVLGYKVGSRFNKHFDDSNELRKRETEEIIRKSKK